MHKNKNQKPQGQRPMFVSRRVVLKSGAMLSLSAIVPLTGLSACGNSPSVATGSTAVPSNGNPPATPTVKASFLNEKQKETLAAFVDRLIPADTDPGALAADCATGIDAYLAAFLTDPPFIYAGAPFSDRGGNDVNEFQAFVPLDPYEAFAWRIVIEGSAGLAEREFNGPVTGLQEIYRDGLQALNEAAVGMGAECFADLSAAQRDLIIGSNNAAINELVDVGFIDTINFMYGAPEYGGNQDLAGWGFTEFFGDVQPRGFTDSEVINADQPGVLDFTLPASYSETATNSNKPQAAGSFKASSGPKRNPISHTEALQLVQNDPRDQAQIIPSSPDNMAGLMAACEGRLRGPLEQTA